MNPFIISLAIRLTVLLVAGGLVVLAVQRSTSALRHVVLAATLACVIVLPVMMLLVPEWRVGVLPAAARPLEAIITDAPAAIAMPRATRIEPTSIRPVLITSQLSSPVPTVASMTSTTSMSVMPASESPSSLAPIIADAPSSPAPFVPTIPQIALAIWLVGVAIGVLWITAGRIGLARVRRGATRLATMEWRTILETEAMHAGVARHVALFTSPAVSMPVTWGVLAPVIVLPESALAWTHERKRVVVMHEMAHIARRDSATQLVATLACVAYWIHPLVILAARRLRAECERACDERVLERGTPATDYAAHLLEVARLSRSFGAASIVSVAMARPSQLEGRLLAVLRAKPRHSQLSRGTRVLATATAATLLMAVSAFRPVVREAHAVQSHAVRPQGVQPHAAQSHSSPRVFRMTISPDTAATVATATASKTASAVATERAARATTVAVSVATATSASTATAVATATSANAVTSAVAVGGSIVPSSNLLSNPQHPDSSFEKAVAVREGGTLVLELDTGGNIKITGSDADSVSVSGSLGGPDWRGTTVSLDASGGDARLESRYDRKSSRGSFTNSFTIRVPKRYNVRVSSAGGGVSIDGVEGTFTGNTGGGRIIIDHAKGDADLSTGGGSIRISNSHLDGNVSTGGGSVNFVNVTGSIVPGSGDGSVRSYGSRGGRPEDFEIISSSDTDAASIERARAAMDRARAAMRRAQMGAEGSMMRERAKMKVRQHMKVRVDDDSASVDSYSDPNDEMDTARDEMDMSRDNMNMTRDKMKISRESMDRFGEQMEQNRKMIDSARIVIDRNRIDIDKAGTMFHLKMLPFQYKLEGLNGEFSDGEGSKGTIVIDKDGGSIRVLRAPNGAHVATGGGEIVIGSSGGGVSALTGAGRIMIGRTDGSARATTGAGDVMITAGGGQAHPVDVRSGSGNVEVLLPKGANATLDLETAYTQNFGKETKITSDWPLDVTHTSEWDDSDGSPRKYVRVRQKIGNGGPLIRVRTVNGDIRLRQTK